MKDSGGARQLKGAYEQLEKCTTNFSGNNEIGEGGYGKVAKKNFNISNTNQNPDTTNKYDLISIII